MNLLDTYNENGTLVPERLFVANFGVIPNSLCLTFNDEPDCNVFNVTEDLIRELFPDVISWKKAITKYSVIEGEKKSSDREMKVATSGSFLTILCENYKVYVIDNDTITCRFYSKFYKEIDIEKELLEIWEKLPKEKEESKSATVNLVGFNNGDYYTIESKIKATNLNIEENYNDDFLPVFNDTIEFLKTRESGLVLYHGKMGSGKTSVIRHLITNYPADYIIVPTSLTTRLSDPDFITFMIDNSDSVFILEDCEQLLMDRATNMFNGAISNILNMSDGLLSDIMNLKFICTFNADIASIDEALLRKGRCYARYEFSELCEEKVAALNEKYDLGISEIKPMTLAEVYNSDKTEYTETKRKRKIGF